MTEKLVARFFSLVLLVLCCGCSPSHPRADLIFINGAEPETLDPALITGQPEGRIVNALFEGLLRFDKRGHALPGVASSWKSPPINGPTPSTFGPLLDGVMDVLSRRMISSTPGAGLLIP